jgi:hypothetical protein
MFSSRVNSLSGIFIRTMVFDGLLERWLLGEPRLTLVVKSKQNKEIHVSKQQASPSEVSCKCDHAMFLSASDRYRSGARQLMTRRCFPECERKKAGSTKENAQV